MQHVNLAAVREAHVLEAHPDLSGRKRPRVRGLGQRLDSVEPAEAATGGSERSLCEVENPADRLERPDELQQERLEEDELPDRQISVNDGAPAEEDDGCDRETRQIVETRHMLRLDTRLAERRGAHSFGTVAEALTHVVLTSEGLHHLDPDDGLVRRFRHVALAGLHLARDGRDEPPEAVRDEPDQRQRDGRVESELPVDEPEDDPGRDDHHHALHPLHEAPADEVADRIEVVRRPRQHLARGMPVVERPRVAEVRLVEQLAHPRLDPDADPGGGVTTVEVDDEAQECEPPDRGQIRRELVLLVGNDRVVDRLRDQDRDRDRDQRVGERAGQAEGSELPLLAPESEQASEGRQQAEVGRVD